MATERKLIAIVGPTASGKTALAIEVAKKYNGEIICADSRTIYKGLDIGTAKPTKAEQQAIKHHGLDLIEPSETFSAASFQILARQLIDDIWSRGKQPILVGGTGLYVNSVIFDYKFGPAADQARRAELNKLSVEALRKLCKKNNIELPENHQNKRYLIRAIELGGINHKGYNKLFYNTVIIGLNPNREILLSRIEKRAKQIFKQSVVNEAAKAAKKYGWKAPGLSGNIYPIVNNLLIGKLSPDQAVKEFITIDWHLAKRQLTWFRRNPYIKWFNDDKSALTEIVRLL